MTNAFPLGVCLKGLDLSGSRASVKDGYASMVINMYADNGDLVLRNGATTAFSLSGGTPIETLHVHRNTSGQETLIVCAGGAMYKVHNGAIQASTPLALFAESNAKWVTCQFGYETGRSFFVNGTNIPQVFDGSTMSAVKFGSYGGFSGGPASLTDFSHVWSYKARLYFATSGTDVYYGNPGEIQGDLSAPYHFGEFFTEGGYIIWGGAVSAQQGNVSQDLFCVLSSEGEMLLYAGDSPEGAWGLVSRLKFPKPVGRRCGLNYNGDLLILTIGGLFSVKRTLATQNVTKQASIAKDVQEGITKAARLSAPHFAWQMIQDTNRGHLLINLPNTSLYVATSNVPNTYYSVEGPQVGWLPQDYWNYVEPGKTEQLVMTESLGSWFLFKGWDALCFAMYEGELYFGTNTGVVAKAHSGRSDLGTDIPVVVEWASSHMGDRIRVKQFTQVAPQWQINGKLKFGWGVSTDYNPKQRLSTNSIFSGNEGFAWDTYKWGGWKWSDGLKYYRRHYSIRGSGKVASLILAFYGKNVDVRLSGVHVLFNPGGIR